MFTGIIEELGELASIAHGKDLTRLTISAIKVLDGTMIGDSISVNGTCLTVTEMDNGSFKADIMPETLRKTEFGHYQKGLTVNLERALRVGDRLGGHMVSGHIDGGATLESMKRLNGVSELKFRLDQPHEGLIIPKGSIAIDGISLTIMEVGVDYFMVGIIPHTLQNTNLGQLKKGNRVNIEYDIYGKYVQAQHNAKQNHSLSESEIKEWGY